MIRCTSTPIGFDIAYGSEVASYPRKYKLVAVNRKLGHWRLRDAQGHELTFINGADPKLALAHALCWLLITDGNKVSRKRRK